MSVQIEWLRHIISEVGKFTTTDYELIHNEHHSIPLSSLKSLNSQELATILQSNDLDASALITRWRDENTTEWKIETGHGKQGKGNLKLKEVES